MILASQDIKAAKPLLPLVTKYKQNGLSGGLSYCGYDVALDQDVFLWPKGFTLASTKEYFDMPNSLAASVHDKSTWIRNGVAVNNTFIEPGWRGYLTLELVNHKWWFKRIKRGTPIAQVVFHMLSNIPEQVYDGKYQEQARGPVGARL